jgi:cellulose synthase/poly-beta-1,6-N-acetylglucosamine synthase-like glycosyltransferase
MEVLNKIVIIPEVILMAYLGLASLYFLVFAVASRLYREKNSERIDRTDRVTVLIPAYKEDEVIVETARSAMNHYSENAFLDVMVIADSLKPETHDRIRETGAMVLAVTFENSTKSKALNKSLEAINSKCDYVIILDADNRMETGFVDRILHVARQGYRVVQGHRTAKNNNTSLAVLDGISEEVNNAIFRRGHRVLGLSASLIGSGFISEYKLLKELMQKARAVGGFDKELELMLLERKITIGYASKAHVYDEKIQESGAFVNQRRRWLAAQFTYFGKNIGKGFVQLIGRGNIDYFDKLLQFVLPPRIVTTGLAALFSAFRLTEMIWSRNATGEMALAWISLLGVSLLAIILSIPSRQYNSSLYRSLLFVPAGFLLILKALLNLKGANKKFIHTQHNESN